VTLSAANDLKVSVHIVSESQHWRTIQDMLADHAKFVVIEVVSSESNHQLSVTATRAAAMAGGRYRLQRRLRVEGRPAADH
jgi:hypothetical protein